MTDTSFRERCIRTVRKTTGPRGYRLLGELLVLSVVLGLLIAQMYKTGWPAAIYSEWSIESTMDTTLSEALFAGLVLGAAVAVVCVVSDWILQLRISNLRVRLAVLAVSAVAVLLVAMAVDDPVQFANAWADEPVRSIQAVIALLSVSACLTFVYGVVRQIQLGQLAVTRRRAAIGGVLVIVLAAPVVGLHVAATAGAVDANNQQQTEPYPTVADFRDGYNGPGMFSDRLETGPWRSATTAFDADRSIRRAPPHKTDYTPKTVHPGPEAFQIQRVQFRSLDGDTERLRTRFGIRLNDDVSAAEPIRAGIYGVSSVDQSDWVVDPAVDPVDNMAGSMVAVEPPRDETVYIYVDVVQDGEVHRYVTGINLSRLGEAP